MAEGKTLVNSAPCDLCEGDNSVNFCTNCQQDLCLRCSTAHRKIPDLSHHKLRPVTDRTSVVVPKATQAYCKDHPSRPLSVICEKCLKALCGTCADAEHRHHKLLRTNLNAELLHRICVQKVPEFLDLLQKLDKEKDGSPAKLQLYKQARDMVKRWRDHLQKIIEDDSKELLTKIEEEIKNQEILLGDISSNLKDAVSTTEQQMSVLSNARKINNTGTLLTNIQDGDKIIEKARKLLDDIESTRESLTIDDVLPFRNELSNIEKDLRTFFSLTQVSDRSYTPVIRPTSLPSIRKIVATKGRNYSSMVKIDKQHIGKYSQGYLSISESSVQNSKTIFIYNASGCDIYEFDTDINQKKKFACPKNILKMATLASDRHVIIDRYDRSVHLLGESFQILTTVKYKPYGVCSVSTDTFILSEPIKFGSQTRMSEVKVSSTNKLNIRKICEVAFKDDYGHLSLHSDKNHLTMKSSGQTMHTADLATGRFTEINLSHIMTSDSQQIRCIHVDEAGYILVGDDQGRIHLTTKTKYECELQNMKNTNLIGGISIIGNKMVIVAGEYINIYQ